MSLKAAWLGKWRKSRTTMTAKSAKVAEDPTNLAKTHQGILLPESPVPPGFWRTSSWAALSKRPHSDKPPCQLAQTPCQSCRQDQPFEQRTWRWPWTAPAQLHPISTWAADQKWCQPC